MMKVKCNAQQLKDSVAQKNLAINLKAASLFFGPVFPSLMSGNLTAKQTYSNKIMTFIEV